MLLLYCMYFYFATYLYSFNYCCSFESHLSIYFGCLFFHIYFHFYFSWFLIVCIAIFFFGFFVSFSFIFLLLFFVNLCQLKFKHFSLFAPVFSSVNVGRGYQIVDAVWWYLFGHLLENKRE